MHLACLAIFAFWIVVTIEFSSTNVPRKGLTKTQTNYTKLKFDYLINVICWLTCYNIIFLLCAGCKMLETIAGHWPLFFTPKKSSNQFSTLKLASLEEFSSKHLAKTQPTYIGVNPKIGVFSPPKSSILINRVFHYFHHPFWWVLNPLFLVQHPYL